MTEGHERQFCTSCGAESRPGNAFCASCGARLTAGAHSPDDSGTPPPVSPSFDGVREKLEGAMGGIREASWRLDGDTLRGFPRRAIQWFRDLQSVPKRTLLVAVALAFLMLLSPLILVIAALVLVVSVIAFTVRVTKKGSVRGWGITAGIIGIIRAIDKYFDDLARELIGHAKKSTGGFRIHGWTIEQHVNHLTRVTFRLIGWGGIYFFVALILFYAVAFGGAPSPTGP